jgi:hypothetical protein
MARPIIVTGVTTAGGAEFGPVRNHGEGPYSRMAGAVKAVQTEGDSDQAKERAAACTAIVSEAGDAAVQIVMVGALDFRGHDLADP